MADQFLIVGLGNPGKQYESTRHNIGFTVVEAMGRRCNIAGKQEKRFNAMVGTGRCGSHRIILAQPLTYMNLSGEAVIKILNYYDLEPGQMLVVYDEAALPFGRMRIRPSGSDAGQKGIRSIIKSLGGNQEFPRLRIGIGGPPAKMAMPDFVLSRFDSEEQKDLPRIVDTAVECVESWMDYGMERSMERYNGLDLIAPNA